MKHTFNCLFIVATVTVLSASCKHADKTMFTEIPSSHSNVNFSNEIKEDEDYNILTWEYLYNDGGMAVGDINNDGLPDLMFTGNMVPDKLYLK